MIASPRPSIDLFLPSVSRFLPDDALGSELAVEFWIDAIAAMVNIEALAALLTESCLVFLAGPDCLSIRVISALHLFFAPSPFFNLFETGRGLSST